MSLTDNVSSIGPHPARDISEAQARLERALASVIPILEAVRFTAGLGKTQLARIAEAKAALDFARNHSAANTAFSEQNDGTV